MEYECIKDERKLMECPFKNVEKEIGHHPYVIKSDGWYHVQCTCGARGPMAPRELEVTGWNNQSIETQLEEVRERLQVAVNTMGFIKDSGGQIPVDFKSSFEYVKNGKE